MPEKEPVSGLASSSASQAITLEETDGLRELLVQLIDERLRAVYAGLAEAAVSDQAKKEDGIGPLDPGPETSTRAEGGEKSRRRREDPTLNRMISQTGTRPPLRVTAATIVLRSDTWNAIQCDTVKNFDTISGVCRRGSTATETVVGHSRTDGGRFVPPSRVETRSARNHNRRRWINERRAATGRE